MKKIAKELIKIAKLLMADKIIFDTISQKKPHVSTKYLKKLKNI